MDNNKEESTIPYKPTEADLKWLKGEETKDIVPMQMAGLYVPRKIFKRVVVRSIILSLMVWPIVPYTVNAVIENLTITNFEVGAIQINGGENIIVRKEPAANVDSRIGSVMQLYPVCCLGM